MSLASDLLSGIAGALVGTVLALVGGGGSVLAVPMLVYGVGVASTHVAIGTSAIAVSVSAFATLIGHWRAGNVKWRCGLVFAASGILGAFAGSEAAKSIDGQKLLGVFGFLMIVVGAMMFFKRDREGDDAVHLDRSSAAHLLPWLIPTGFATGLLSGFFGIGGGFLIVPALIFSTGMALQPAIGTSLVAVTAFGATTAANYAVAGLVDWRIAVLFIAGGVIGGVGGAMLGRVLSARKGALGTVLAVVVVAVGIYVMIKSIGG